MAYLSRIKSVFKPKAKASSATSSATLSAIPSATTPEQFVELTNACKDRAQGMLAINVDGSMSRLRVNGKQCKYLAEKLNVAVGEAETLLCLQESRMSQGEQTNLLNKFKLLHNFACAVESYIQNCCKDTWVATAFLMPSMSQDALSISVDLALLAHSFSGNLMMEVESVYDAEASVMTEKSENDRHLLLRNVKALLRAGEKSSTEYRLARLLLKKIETPGVYCTEYESLTEESGCLGKGASAKVYKAMWLGIDVAVKTFHGPRSPYFETEVSIVGGLSHPNLASLFCYAEDDRECSIVMELMDCDLSDMIRNIMRDKSRKPRYPFSIFEAVDIMLQVGNGVKYLHEMKIVHRDLKAANILVKQLGNWGDGESKSILAKVADFGLAKTKEKSMTYSTQTFNKGTARWMAPEVIQMRRDDGQEKVSSDSKVMKYPYRSDVYSFGMVCYEILTGRLPYDEVHCLSQIKQKILSGDRPELPEHCFAELKDLIERCWSQDAIKRPRFDEICAKLRGFRFRLLLPDTQVAIKLCGEAKIFVGLDFGTTFSGYAFAHKSSHEDIGLYWHWPGLMKPYCKTLTAIYYEAGDATTAKVKTWGFPALRDYTKDINNIQKLRAKSAVDMPAIGTYLVRFKLHLASKDAGESSAAMLPEGFTVTQVIADYLREIGAHIMSHLRQWYSEITMADVQWCVPVPSVWDDHAKRQMRACMARAGLVRSVNSPEGSPHPVDTVIEPDAALYYCYRSNPYLELKVGDQLLLADLGGGTTEIVVQEWISETPDNFKVKMVTCRTDGVCGGTILDEQFIKLLFAKIQCLPQLLQKDAAVMRSIVKEWEEIKRSFGDLATIGESFEIELPNKLAVEWEEFDEEHGNPARSSYDELELTYADIKAIFDPVVEQNLTLIADQISRTAIVKVIFVVGGFAGSPYLLTKIKERFLGTVEKVISPVHPGSAVCQGAVMLALNLAGITSRRVSMRSLPRVP